MDFHIQKNILKQKYSRHKIRYYLHLAALYIKNLYHRPIRRTAVYGEQNQITHSPKGLKIEIWGNGNLIDIDPSVSSFHGEISIGEASSPAHNCTIKIGANSFAAGVHIALREDESSVTIGKECMFSWNINIWNTDFHAIYDEKTKNCLNLGKQIIIGHHVWLGNGVYILKNTEIASNSVVGANAVVSNKFTEENVILAGIPAKVVKRGINWSADTPKEYLQKNQIHPFQ